jgi:hypothetical protein
MALSPTEIEQLINASAPAMGLRLTTEQRRGVATYLALAADMAELVQGLPLGRDDESGSVFAPVAPAGAGSLA